MGNHISKSRKRVKKRTTSVKSGRPAPASFTTTQSTISDSTDGHTGDTKFDQARYDADQIQELHYLIKHVFQRNLLSPAGNVLSVPGAQCLDIGCGPTATWLIDIATEFPHATFTGADIVDVDGPDSPALLPRHIPANCRFEKINVLQTIDLNPASFDLVYQRFMFNVYPMDDSLESKFKEIAGLLKPGGWMECIEPDMIPHQAGPKYTILTNALNDMLKPKDGVLFHGPVIKQCLVDAGLVDIQSDYSSIPICWGGYVGKMIYETIVSILGKLGEPLWPMLGLEGDYDEKTFVDFMDSAFDECVEYKTYVNFHWAYGRRPIDVCNKES